ncbi:hypothetical protein [Roseomonas sp. BN140053]|uniref:hypothetical protein n=1 Tax=Roseomonas sp. BN140053 TaxID=3391898 RepID=UPI0039EC47B8
MMRRLLFGLLLLAAPALARPAAAQDDPSFNLVNRSGQTIREIYASSARDQSWGRDRLGADVLPNGRSFPVRLPASSGCQTDIRVVFQDSRAEERRAVNTCNTTDVVFGAGQGGSASGGKPGASGGSQATTGNPSFNLVNAGTRVLQELYATPTSQEDWGADQLGDATVPPGGRFPVRFHVGPCRYDIRVVWEGGQSEERRDVDLCSVADVTFRDGAARR